MPFVSAHTSVSWVRTVVTSRVPEARDALDLATEHCCYGIVRVYQRCVRQAKITEVRNRQCGRRDQLQGLAVQRFENQVRSSLQHWVCFTPSNESAFTHTVAPTQGAPLIVSTCPEACSDKLVVDEAVFVLARQVMMQTHIQSGT